MGSIISIKGARIFVTDKVAPEAWEARTEGTRVKDRGHHHAVYASTYLETDQGVEIEVSALVDFRVGGRVVLDDYRCRIVDGPDVELDDALLDALHDRLLAAAERRLLS